MKKISHRREKQTNSNFFKFENGIVYNVNWIISVSKDETKSRFTINEDGGIMYATLQDYDNFVERFVV
jgi:hypothetical protein